MTISGQSSLSKDDIAGMVRDAEVHAKEDAEKRINAQERNKADSLIYGMEKMLTENAEKISAPDAKAARHQVESLRSALLSADIDSIKSLTENLKSTLGSLGQKLYDLSADAAPGSGGPQPADDEDIIDAEVVDENR